jgi:hypothetical protein
VECATASETGRGSAHKLPGAHFHRATALYQDFGDRFSRASHDFVKPAARQSSRRNLGRKVHVPSASSCGSWLIGSACWRMPKLCVRRFSAMRYAWCRSRTRPRDSARPDQSLVYRSGSQDTKEFWNGRSPFHPATAHAGCNSRFDSQRTVAPLDCEQA